MKVEWNKSPKPFSPTYDGQSSAKKSKSDDLMTKGSGSLNVMSVGKSASETVVPPQTRPKPIDTESSTSGTPSKRPLSAKLASFEEKITANTPGLAKSTHVPKTPKQVNLQFISNFLYITVSLLKCYYHHIHYIACTPNTFNVHLSLYNFVHLW